MKCNNLNRKFHVILEGSILILVLFFHNDTNAQLKSHNALGDLGLQSGSQPPPGVNLLLPLYLYDAAKLKDKNGDITKSNIELSMFFGGPGVNLVSNFKLLGANVGGTILFPFAKNRLQDTSLIKTPLAFTDMYIQPLQLGWHLTKFDVVAGYALFIPTGKYEYGADDNAGLGMWSNEFSAGSTFFIDEKKTFSIAAFLAYEIHSKKKSSETKTGDVLSIEGGVGKTIYKKTNGSPIPMIFNFGVAYYMQFKTSDDQIAVGSSMISPEKDHIYALGPEAGWFIPKLRSQITARWLREFSAQNRFEGGTLMFTWAYILKSLHKETPAGATSFTTVH